MYNTNVFLIIKKIEDIRKRKINQLKEIKNQKNYLKAVLISHKLKERTKERKAVIKKLEDDINELIAEKDYEVTNLLKLKSSFSIIDEMFLKEIENAEIFKKCCFRWFYYFFEKDKMKDPREISTFVEDVMDPYGRQDKIIKELKEKEAEMKKEKEAYEKERERKQLKKDDEKLKNVWNAVNKTKTLMKENVSLIEKIYDKLEKGQLNNKNNKSDQNENSGMNSIFTLKKIPHIVELFGTSNDKPNFDHIKLSIDEIKDNDIDNEDRKSRRSDSSNSLDCDVECEKLK